MWHKNSGAFVFEVSFAIALWPVQVPVAMQEIHLYKHAAPSIVRAILKQKKDQDGKLSAVDDG